MVTFERTDGVAENFHTEQNRELLEKLSSQTGGKYWKADELARLPKEISYSEAGISVRDTKELWDMPIVFLLLLGLMARRVAAAAEVGCDLRGRLFACRLLVVGYALAGECVLRHGGWAWRRAGL